MKLTENELLNFTADRARDTTKNFMKGSLINTLEAIQTYASEGKTYVIVSPFNNIDREILVRELLKLGYTIFLEQDGKLSIHWG